MRLCYIAVQVCLTYYMTRKHETETSAEQTETVTDLDRIKQLEAQKRALDEQLKQAKAAMPKLERLIAEQTARPPDLINLNRVKARIAAGQERDEALDAVMESARAWIEAQLDSEAE
jgi:hypothetical protein